MMQLNTVETVMNEFVETLGGWGELAYDKTVGDPFEVPNLGIVTLLDVETSGEGGGEHTHVVFRLRMVDGSDRVFMKTGCYMSHYGNDWDGPLTEVRGVEKVVVEYVRV